MGRMLEPVITEEISTGAPLAHIALKAACPEVSRKVKDAPNFLIRRSE